MQFYKTLNEDYSDERKQFQSESSVPFEYEIDPSTEYYDELENALTFIPNYNDVYRKFYDTFNKLINQNTSILKVNFSGPYPKTNYLLKKYNANWLIRKRVHDTRVRLREKENLPNSSLEENCLYDLQSLCEFITLIYQKPIPLNLKEKFSHLNNQIKIKHSAFEDSVRIIVSSWDDYYLYGQLENEQYEQDIRINFYNDRGNWSYLKELLYENCQINLIKPSWKVKHIEISAEYMIFEPDYLIEISTIAGCFEQYAEDAIVNIIKKIKPRGNTFSTLLGGFASQFLDESVTFSSDYPYKQSATKFFKENALALTQLSKEETQRFHQEAAIQKNNITNAMSIALSESYPKFYDHRLAIIEPSFFSEMLGIQGRMDYLQTDFNLLIEQKSGKGEYPYENFIKPRETKQHYVQMLLYMMIIRYNYSNQYNKNNRDVHAFLLYSKYRESLLALNWAPKLTFNAIKVRNQLAWFNNLYATPDGFKLLENISANNFNLNNINTPLWNRFQKIEIDGILSKIHKSTTLEKNYFYRYLTFIALEHKLCKIGNKTKDNTGFASKWHNTLDNKLAAGNIYASLKLTIPDTLPIEKLTFTFEETTNNDIINFRVGDIVVAYPYEDNTEPDIRKNIAFRCSIESIDSNSISLHLRSAQSNPRVFQKDIDKLWAIEHDFYESSFNALYQGMYAFLCAPQKRKDLLLFEREPEIDKTIVHLKSNVCDDFKELAIRVKQAKDFFLIIGPPGTGKTSYGLITTLKEELAEDNTSVLLMAYTNRAVDEICDKLIEENLDFIRIGNKFTSSPQSQKHLLNEQVRNAQNIEQLKTAISNMRIFVGTTAALTSSLVLFNCKQFSLAIIDEASQLLEPYLLPLLSAHYKEEPAIKKFVLIGDHKQLPAVVQQTQQESIIQEQNLNEILLKDCRQSFFERLLNKYRDNHSITYMLTKQGRMHPDIALFPNFTFYNNQLSAVPRNHQKITLPTHINTSNGIESIIKTRRISFIAVDKPKQSSSDKINQAEADVIAAFVMEIYKIHQKDFDPSKTVGVIVPYRIQIATIRNSLIKYGIKELTDITIDTVERYQGSQRKYILYGFTVQRYYQLKFLTNNTFEDSDGTIIDRKLNVAMTRAEEGLIMIGNPYLLANNFIFFKLMEFIRSRHGYFKINFTDLICGNFHVPTYNPEEIDLSKAIYLLTNKFETVFQNLVYNPIKEESRDEWPQKVLGFNMRTNLETIGYGRINFTNQLSLFTDKLSPEKQVLLYCYYIMRQHYCSSSNIYTSYKEWIQEQITSTNGRLQFIDIGCGPATCGIAFFERFCHNTSFYSYTGIDISSAMKRMGLNMMNQIFSNKVNYRMLNSFSQITAEEWEEISQLSSTIIINISYFFSNVSASFTEKLALQIANIIESQPLNKYIFIIQHGECDTELQSYKIFRKIIDKYVYIIKDELSTFSYILKSKEKQLEFCYTILSNK